MLPSVLATCTPGNDIMRPSTAHPNTTRILEPRDVSIVDRVSGLMALMVFQAMTTS